MPITGCSPFYEKKMKKVILFAVLILSLSTIVSCSGKQELKHTKGVVTSFVSHKDSLISARVVVDSDTLLFQLADVRLVNGMFLKGDSVSVDYVEDNEDMLHAFVIAVLPKPVQYIDLNDEKSDSLVTRPDEPADSLQ